NGRVDAAGSGRDDAHGAMSVGGDRSSTGTGSTDRGVTQPRTETTSTRVAAPLNFAQSTDGAIRRFTDAIRQGDIDAIRGQITQELATELQRRLAGVAKGHIVVQTRSVEPDSAHMKAYFFLNIKEDSRSLIAADFVANFIPTPRGYRLTSVDRP